MREEITFSSLLGLTIVSIDGAKKHSEEIIFTDSLGNKYRMHHYQDCCEHVSIDDIDGDIDILIGSPILLAEETTSDQNPSGVKPEYQDSFTWTFYRLATIKGPVVIRWYGESNGYYSESVTFERL